MENLRTIFLYVQGATERSTFPTGQAGTNPLFNFSRDSQGWGGGHYWHWNMRMHLAANLGAGNTDANLPRFRLYRDNLESIRSWTTQRMGGRPGICVPETMRFDGTGWYTGTDDGNPSCYAAGAAGVEPAQPDHRRERQPRACGATTWPPTTARSSSTTTR